MLAIVVSQSEWIWSPEMEHEGFIPSGAPPSHLWAGLLTGGADGRSSS